MNIAPIYELKSRLRAAAIAGTNLLSEDFRLKKALEGFAPLEKASPVFAKIGEMTNKLLSDNSPESLLDTITLVDSVITTLGTTEVKGEIKDLPDEYGYAAEVRDIPYSKLKALIDALTTPGSGNYEIVASTNAENPEIFRDYRVTEPLVRGLSAKYSELADLVEKIVIGIGRDTVPLLKKGFNPKGGKDMARRLKIIEEFGGAAENEFYLANLDESEKLMRRRLIYALRRDAGNLDKLIELSKTEKGKAKQTALTAIMAIDSEGAEKYIREYAAKKPLDVFKLLMFRSNKWVSDLTAELMERLLDSDGLSKLPDKKPDKNVPAWKDCLNALIGKFGPKIEKIYREFYRTDKFDPNCIDNVNYLKNFSYHLDAVLATTIAMTGDKDLMKLAIEMNNGERMKGRYPISEMFARLMSDEDCMPWLEEKFANLPKRNIPYNTVLEGLRLISWEDGEYKVMCHRFSWNDLTEDDEYFFGSVKQPVATKITDLVLKYYKEFGDGSPGDRGANFAWTLQELINPDDKEQCGRIADYIQKFPLEREDVDVLLACDARNVKGLAYAYVKDMDRIDTYIFNYLFKDKILGDHEFKVAEAEELIGLAAKRKLLYKPDEKQVQSLKNWLDANRETL